MHDGSAMSMQLLGRIPLLSSLEHGQLRQVSEAASWVTVPRGTYLFRQGDPGDALYIVESGVLEAVIDEGQTSEQAVSVFARGDYFGEMALLTGQERSATIRALTDSQLISLSKENFERLLQRSAPLAIGLSRTLSRRLYDTNESLSRRGSCVSVLIPVGALDTAGTVAVELVESLKAQLQDTVLSVFMGLPFPDLLAGIDLNSSLDEDLHVVESPSGSGYFAGVADEAVRTATDSVLLSVLDRFRQRFGHVLLWIPPDVARERPAVLGRAVRTVIVGCGPHASQAALQVANDLPFLSKAGLRTALTDEPGNRSVIFDALASPVWIGDLSRAGPQVGASPGVDRLARAVVGSAIGVSLSGGAAQGVAHLGVLQALWEAGVPVDMLVGTSGGALYGSMIAAGTPIQDAQDMVVYNTRHNLLDRADFVIPRFGLLRGRRIERLIRDAIGEVTFEQLPMPLRVVATDLSNGQEVVLRSGPVYKAVRASISIPGVFEPYRLDGRVLVDGAVVNPLPVRSVRDMGADYVIACHVPAPSRVADEQKRRSGRRPDQGHNLMSTLVRSYAFAGDVLADISATEADVCVRPDVAEFHWRDYRSSPAIIGRGLSAGREAMPAIAELLPLMRAKKRMAEMKESEASREFPP